MRCASTESCLDERINWFSPCRYRSLTLVVQHSSTSGAKRVLYTVISVFARMVYVALLMQYNSFIPNCKGLIEWGMTTMCNPQNLRISPGLTFQVFRFLVKVFCFWDEIWLTIIIWAGWWLISTTVSCTCKISQLNWLKTWDVIVMSQSSEILTYTYLTLYLGTCEYE